MRRAAALLVAAALAGCGGDEETGSAPGPTPAPTAAATEPPAPTPAETETPSPTATEQPSPSPEEQEGGAGDEEEARVPVRFTVGPAGVDPPEVGVPAFLALELIVRNTLAEPVAAQLEGADPISVAPGGDRARAPGGPPARPLRGRLRPRRAGRAGDRRGARAIVALPERHEKDHSAMLAGQPVGEYPQRS